MTADIKNSIWISLAVILLSIISYYIGLSFIFKNIAQTTFKIKEKNVAISRLSNSPDILANLKNQAQVVAPYENALKSLIPPQESLLEVPRWIEGLARARNINSTFSFQGEPGITPGSLGVAAFYIQGYGGYQDLIRLVRDMEVNQPKYLLNISSFSINRHENAYRAEIYGTIFHSGPSSSQENNATST
jgi:hypothetical protein